MSNSSAGLPSITVSVGRVSVIRKVSHGFTFHHYLNPDGAVPLRARLSINLSGEMS